MCKKSLIISMVILTLGLAFHIQKSHSAEVTELGVVLALIVAGEVELTAVTCNDPLSPERMGGFDVAKFYDSAGDDVQVRGFLPIDLIRSRGIIQERIDCSPFMRLMK